MVSKIRRAISVKIAIEDSKRCSNAAMGEAEDSQLEEELIRCSTCANSDGQVWSAAHLRHWNAAAAPTLRC